MRIFSVSCRISNLSKSSTKQRDHSKTPHSASSTEFSVCQQQIFKAPNWELAALIARRLSWNRKKRKAVSSNAIESLKPDKSALTSAEGLNQSCLRVYPTQMTSSEMNWSKSQCFVARRRSQVLWERSRMLQHCLNDSHRKCSNSSLSQHFRQTTARELKH